MQSSSLVVVGLNVLWLVFVSAIVVFLFSRPVRSLRSFVTLQAITWTWSMTRLPSSLVVWLLWLVLTPLSFASDVVPNIACRRSIRFVACRLLPLTAIPVSSVWLFLYYRRCCLNGPSLVLVWISILDTLLLSPSSSNAVAPTRCIDIEVKFRITMMRARRQSMLEI